MSLPGDLKRLIAKIVTQTNEEAKLLSTLIRKLESSLSALRKVFGNDCAERCYAHLMDCVRKEASTGCLDQYEEWVERCVATRLGRTATEAEELLLGELLNQITGITEVLLQLAGVELAEEPDEEEADGIVPPIR